MPQQKRSLALIYAVNPFGADHESSEHDFAYTPGSSPVELERMAQIGLTKPQPATDLGPEKVRFALYSQYLYSALDSLDLCQFVFGGAWQLYDSNQVVELMQAVTGWKVSLWELMKLGERRVNLMRAFNAREGIARDHDTLPKKMFQPLQGGKSAGVSVDPAAFERALETYYAMAGWDIETGIPTRGKLQELDLGWVADELGL
jgi:aldehyde:ferredoxin oxidoreductase